MRRLVFPYIPPGANVLHRMHHHEVAKWRRQIHGDMGVVLAVADGSIYPVVGERHTLTLDFRWRDRRRRDLDNAVAGAKAVIDSLVGVWIVDDDTEHLELVVKGQTGTGEPDHIIVTVEET